MPDTPDIKSNDNILLDGIHFASFSRNGKFWRLGATVPNWPEELTLLGQNPVEGDLAKAAVRGIWLGTNESSRPLAVMCCGLGAAWPHMGRELYDNFPVCRNAMDHLAAIADWDLLSLMDESDLELINQTRLQIPYLFLLEYAQWSQFQALGLKPALMSGHSLGELAALCFAGVYSPETAWHLLDTRAEHIAILEKKLASDGGMLAVSVNPQAAYAILPDFPQVRVANRNTSSQIILSGARDELLKIRKILRREHVPAIMLNMNLAFHNPAMRYLRDLSLRRLNALAMFAPAIPMLSCTRSALYPIKQKDICDWIADLDENTVDWVKSIETMRNVYGIRHWLELGPQEILCGITQENFPEADVTAASRKGREAEFMRAACAKLYSLGMLDSAAIKTRATSHFAQKRQARKADASSLSRFAIKPVKINEKAEPALKIIAAISGKEWTDLKPEHDLRTDLAIRSSRFPYLIQELEKAANRQIPLEALFNITTVKDVLDVYLDSGEEVSKSGKNILLEHPPHYFRTPPLQTFCVNEEKEEVFPSSLCRSGSDKGSLAENHVLAAIFDPEVLPDLLMWLAACGCVIALPSCQESRLAFLRQLDTRIVYLQCPAIPDKEEWAQALADYQKNYGVPDYMIFMPPPINAADSFVPEAWQAIEKITDNFKSAAAPGSFVCKITRLIAKDPIRDKEVLTRFSSGEVNGGGERELRILWLDQKSDYQEEAALRAGVMLADTLSRHESGFFIWTTLFDDKKPGLPVWTDENSGVIQPVYQNVNDWRAYLCRGQISSLSQCSVFHLENAFVTSCYKGKNVSKFPGNASYGEVLSFLISSSSNLYPWLFCAGVSDMEFYDQAVLYEGVTLELESHLIIQPWMIQEKIPTLMVYGDVLARAIAANGRALEKQDKLLKATPLLGVKNTPIKPLWHKDALSSARLAKEILPCPDLFFPSGHNHVRLKIFLRQNCSQDQNMPEWRLDFTVPSGIAVKKNWQYKYFTDILDFIIAALWNILIKKQETRELVGDWRLASIGYLRFNWNGVAEAFSENLKAWAHITWQTADVLRFDVQADNLGGDTVLTAHSIEFEKISLS